MNIKKHLTVIATVLTLASCDPASRLADQIQGTWSGAPERIRDDFTTSTFYVPVYTSSGPRAQTAATSTSMPPSPHKVPYQEQENYPCR